MTKKNILITVGGTGGHVFPAMALAKQLVENNPSYNIFIVGGGLKSNPYFNRNEFPFQEILCGSISLLKPIASLKSLGRILKGIRHSRRLIQDFAPDIVIGFGSYHTLPTLIAAKMESIPIILHEANRIPGKVNRYLSRYAAATAVHFPDTNLRLKGKAVTAAIPLRVGYQKGNVSKQNALAYFKLNLKMAVQGDKVMQNFESESLAMGVDHSLRVKATPIASDYGSKDCVNLSPSTAVFRLNPALKTILIFGGSQGAQAINKLAAQAIIKLPEEIRKQIQILHFTGDSRSQQQVEDIYKQNHIKAVVSDFETRMDLAWQAADFIVSRSGAGTLAEMLEFEVPAILIPYPHATDNHQESNADYMVDIVGGAVKLLERELKADKLLSVIMDFLSDDGYQLQIMQDAMKNHKMTMPSKALHMLVSDMLKGK